MGLLSKIPSWLKNKYTIATVCFLVIMLFLDKNDIFTQMERTKQLNALNESKEFYNKKIKADQKELNLLSNNPAYLEKYAREKYLMKKKNEEVFIVIEPEEKEKN